MIENALAWLNAALCAVFNHRFEKVQRFSGDHRFHMVRQCARCGLEA